MSGLRQAWLVARRELRERARSKALWAGTAIMLVVVVAAIVVPSMLEDGEVTRDVGFTGATPAGLPQATVDQGDAVDVTVRLRRVADQAAGEQAVRDEDLDVLVVDGRSLKWPSDADERLRAVVTGAIQLVAVQERAREAGISAGQLAALSAPVPVDSEELGSVGGRSPDDETAASVMSMLLLFGVATYGQLVLTGVVQEKSSRVVEVLLARMPPRNLLGGKIAGIGLLGFAQLVATVLAALTATVVVDSVDLPAISGGVLAWVVVWFVLGYAMYAVSYGAIGSLASRTEDASSIAAPVTTVLVVGYWATLVTMSEDPAGGWSQAVSLFPATAPFAMPGRVALGVADWWEPVLAAVLTVATVAALVVVGGRVYARAVLHTGPRLGFREVWQRAAAGAPAGAPAEAVPVAGERASRPANGVLVVAAAALGAVAFAVARDAVLGVAVGAGAYGVGARLVRARARSAR